MKVIISDRSREKVYHHEGCPHAVRITGEHRMDITINRANVLGYRRCRCCGNLKGIIRALPYSLWTVGNDRSMEITHQSKTDTVYARTDAGFWKIFWKEPVGLVLYHLNHYDPGKSTEELSRKEFHRQRDVRPTESMVQLFNYIEKHDRAKQIIAEDYRKLPQRTKKQRRYYRQAENRHKRMQADRVLALFADMEKGTNLAQYSFC